MAQRAIAPAAECALGIGREDWAQVGSLQGGLLMEGSAQTGPDAAHHGPDLPVEGRAGDVTGGLVSL